MRDKGDPKVNQSTGGFLGKKEEDCPKRKAEAKVSPGKEERVQRCIYCPGEERRNNKKQRTNSQGKI